jgi:hypothetical protein
MLENESLKRENRTQKQEIRTLNQKIETLENSIDEKIAWAVERACAPLHERIKILETENDRKDAEILRLKMQIDKDSSNSSKPPGTDGFKKIPNNREKSGKKQGGQPGHKGAKLRIPKNLDELVAADTAEHRIISDVPEGAPYVSDWIVDMKVVTVFTEHRRKPGKPPKIEYGAQLKVIAVYLCTIGLMAFQRLSDFFFEISRKLIIVSKATLEKFIRSAADSIDLSPLEHDLLNGKVIHTDETPIKTSERPNADGALETAEKSTFNTYKRSHSRRKNRLRA